jgi:hypothetical protein
VLGKPFGTSMIRRNLLCRAKWQRRLPDEPMESFLNKINEICARMVTDPGDNMKKAEVVKGVINNFYSFAAQETRKVSLRSDFCASMIDQATQTARSDTRQLIWSWARRDLGLGILKCLNSIRQEKIL